MLKNNESRPGLHPNSSFAVSVTLLLDIWTQTQLPKEDAAFKVWGSLEWLGWGTWCSDQPRAVNFWWAVPPSETAVGGGPQAGKNLKRLGSHQMAILWDLSQNTARARATWEVSGMAEGQWGSDKVFGAGSGVQLGPVTEGRLWGWLGSLRLVPVLRNQHSWVLLWKAWALAKAVWGTSTSPKSQLQSCHLTRVMKTWWDGSHGGSAPDEGPTKTKATCWCTQFSLTNPIPSQTEYNPVWFSTAVKRELRL